MHVPSTKDLLAAVPVDRIVDTQAWRQRVHSVGGSLSVGLEHLADARFEGPDTPRASFESPGAITEFASGALDLEVRLRSISADTPAGDMAHHHGIHLHIIADHPIQVSLYGVRHPMAHHIRQKASSLCLIFRRGGIGRMTGRATLWMRAQQPPAGRRRRRRGASRSGACSTSPRCRCSSPGRGRSLMRQRRQLLCGLHLVSHPILAQRCTWP